MPQIVTEIESQPWVWRAAAERAGALPEVLGAGGRAAVVGCGTSYYVAQAFAAAREARGRGESDAFVASEMPARRYDCVLAISRSGTTTEVLRALESLPSGVVTIAVSAVAGTEVVEAADEAVVLDFADERSIVQTRFATAALALLRAHLGDDVAALADEAAGALLRELPQDPGRFERFVFLGKGWTVGLANEAALKLREAAGAWAEAYPAMEFRHGPISASGANTLVWSFGDVDEAVLSESADTGATVVAGRSDPMVELVMAQRMAVALAQARGLDPDHPRFLARSVVLEEAASGNRARREEGR